MSVENQAPDAAPAQPIVTPELQPAAARRSEMRTQPPSQNQPPNRNRTNDLPNTASLS